MPQLSKTATGLTRLQIPVEAGYDGSVFEVERP
jgi:hypothetical protein